MGTAYICHFSFSSLSFLLNDPMSFILGATVGILMLCSGVESVFWVGNVGIIPVGV